MEQIKKPFKQMLKYHEEEMTRFMRNAQKNNLIKLTSANTILINQRLDTLSKEVTEPK